MTKLTIEDISAVTMAAYGRFFSYASGLPVMKPRPESRPDEIDKRAFEKMTREDLETLVVSWKNGYAKAMSEVGALKEKIKNHHREIREGVAPGGLDHGAHLIWWPDELPIPYFDGKQGQRKLTGPEIARDSRIAELEAELAGTFNLRLYKRECELAYEAAMRSSAMAEADNTDVQDRVEKVIGDLTGGRVMPKQVDRLGDAVDRAKRDAAVGRAAR